MCAVLLSMALTGGAYGIGGYEAATTEAPTEAPPPACSDSDYVISGSVSGACVAGNTCLLVDVPVDVTASPVVFQNLGGICGQTGGCGCCTLSGGGIGGDQPGSGAYDGVSLPECLVVVV
jgi:hypothetical protein